jgi:hypothetical protein
MQLPREPIVVIQEPTVAIPGKTSRRKEHRAGMHCSTSGNPNGDKTDLVTFSEQTNVNRTVVCRPDTSTCKSTRNSTFPLFVLDKPALEFCEEVCCSCQIVTSSVKLL